MREIRSEIDIRAPPERVWEILTRFEEYPEWNPFLTIEPGELAAGAHLVVTIRPEGTPSATFRSTVEVARAPAELQWIGRLGVPGLFDGRHRFQLVPLADGRTHFVQSESFRGLFVGAAFYFGVGESTQRGFDRMNEALRRRAEGTAAPPSSSTRNDSVRPG